MTQAPLRWMCTVDTQEVFLPTRLVDELEEAGVYIDGGFDVRLLPAIHSSAAGGQKDRRMFHIYELAAKDLLGWQIRNLFPDKHHLQLEDMLQVFLYIAGGKTEIPLVTDVAFWGFVHTNQVFLVNLWYDEGDGEEATGANLSAEGLGDDRTLYHVCYIVVRAHSFEPPIGMRALTELEYDAYEPGGPSSGQVRPRWLPMSHE